MPTGLRTQMRRICKQLEYSMVTLHNKIYPEGAVDNTEKEEKNRMPRTQEISQKLRDEGLK